MKTRTTASIALALVVILILAIIGTFIGVYGTSKCWYGHKFEKGVCERCGKKEDVTPAKDVADNFLVTPGEERHMKLSATRRNAPSAIKSEYDLYAEIKPASALDKRVDWSITWQDANSEWATGKNLADYVTLVPTAEYSQTAKLTCLQAFGEQIVVTATSLDNPEAVGTRLCNYVQRVTAINFTMPDIANMTPSFTYEYESSAYTVPANISVTLGKMKLTQELRDKIHEMSKSIEYCYEMCPTTDFKNQNLFYLPAKLTLQDNNSIKIEPWNVEHYDVAAAEAYGFVYNNDLTCFYVWDMNEVDQLIDDDRWSDAISKEKLAFKQGIEAITGTHATFDITITAIYGGEAGGDPVVVNSVTKTVNCRFDGSAINIPVEKLTIAGSDIVF